MLQRLYEACKHAFFGPGTIPSPQTIQQLRSILDNMRASDLGLREDMRYFRVNVPELSPFVTIMPIYACDKFSICIFCLPPAAFIPLHNHPGMTVFSKLLFGSMHIKSYDWVTNIPNGSDPESQPNCEGALAAGGVYELLEEIQMPDDFSFVLAPYRGPRIAESN
ncbi:plant cysteine oxidase 2-like isoform X5 [Nymphaea colorata]|nr:plant cysteine oxidase 2-like isoform X5 [Nymphaea colorata]